MIVNWNYEEPEDSLREPLPAGEYPAVLRKANSGIATGKNSGASKLDLVFRVDEKATIRTSIVFCESLAWKTNQFMKAFNIRSDDGVTNFDESALAGFKCIVIVDIEDYEKKDGTAGRANRINGFKRAPQSDQPKTETPF